MIKKVILWTVYALVVGLLVFGAANRTAAKTGQGLLLGGLDEVAGGRIQEDNVSGSEDDRGEFEADDHQVSIQNDELLELSGQIITISSDVLEIQSGSAGILIIEGRSWRFLQESGYVPAAGNDVLVQGFFEDGQFEAAALHDLTAGQIFQIRDEYGRPLWSGRGE